MKFLNILLQSNKLHTFYIYLYHNNNLKKIEENYQNR